jgi:hypothetical protein
VLSSLLSSSDLLYSHTLSHTSLSHILSHILFSTLSIPFSSSSHPIPSHPIPSHPCARPVVALRDLGLNGTYDLIEMLLNKGSGPKYGPRETKILCSMPIGGKPCGEQLDHYDFALYDFNHVKHMMPYSAVTAVQGDATSVTLVLGIDNTEKYIELVIPLLPGDMLIWGGNILHRGRPYAMPNMRMFASFPTKVHKPNNELTVVEDHDIVKS